MGHVCKGREFESFFEFQYPSRDRNEYLHVDLMDVRAADGIRIHFDFDRNGWVIEQASVFRWDVDDEVCDEGWQEVAFCEAWALEVREDDDNG